LNPTAAELVLTATSLFIAAFVAMLPGPSNGICQLPKEIKKIKKRE
jgi:hypothetical protein